MEVALTPRRSSDGRIRPEAGSDESIQAAFFDVDNTMIVGASIFHFAKGLAARKFLSWRDLGRFALRQARLRARGEHKDDLHRARESALAFVAGKQVADIVALCEEIYDESIAAQIWSGTNAIAQQYMADGVPVWLVTATPQELALIIANRLKLTGALGTIGESIDGYYTGALIGDVLHGSAKAAAVQALADREGLDLGRCAAYSDSINDLPLLLTVGHPVAVNPDSALRVEARERGWPVKDFRTGRKAAKIGIPGALAVGTGVGAVVAGRAIRREQQARAAAAAAAAVLARRQAKRRWTR